MKSKKVFTHFSVRQISGKWQIRINDYNLDTDGYYEYSNWEEAMAKITEILEAWQK